jgi:CRP-like cAMP-binding protein
MHLPSHRLVVVRSGRVTLVNRMLEALAPDARQRCEAHLRLVHLTQSQVLIESGETSRYMWFPTTSVLSMIGIGTAGEMMELGTIGATACSDAWLALGSMTSLHRVIVRRAGGAYRLPSDVVRRELHASAPFTRAVQQCAITFVEHVSQSAMCAAFHALLPRLCRWLLVSRDHTSSDTIDLTQEFIAQMLGVTRPRVSQALLVLEAQGIIHQGVARIHIVNRGGLQSLSCDCYERSPRNRSQDPTSPALF